MKLTSSDFSRTTVQYRYLSTNNKNDQSRKSSSTQHENVVFIEYEDDICFARAAFILVVILLPLISNSIKYSMIMKDMTRRKRNKYSYKNFDEFDF